MRILQNFDCWISYSQYSQSTLHNGPPSHPHFLINENKMVFQIFGLFNEKEKNDIGWRIRNGRQSKINTPSIPLKMSYFLFWFVPKCLSLAKNSCELYE